MYLYRLVIQYTLFWPVAVHLVLCLCTVLSFLQVFDNFPKVHQVSLLSVIYLFSLGATIRLRPIITYSTTTFLNNFPLFTHTKSLCLLSECCFSVPPRSFVDCFLDLDSDGRLVSFTAKEFILIVYSSIVSLFVSWPLSLMVNYFTTK